MYGNPSGPAGSEGVSISWNYCLSNGWAVEAIGARYFQILKRRTPIIDSSCQQPAIPIPDSRYPANPAHSTRMATRSNAYILEFAADIIRLGKLIIAHVSLSGTLLQKASSVHPHCRKIDLIPTHPYLTRQTLWSMKREVRTSTIARS